MTITNNIYKQIYALISLDINVALVGDQFFVFQVFESSTSGNTSSTDFCMLSSAICITEFVTLDKSAMAGQPQLYLQQFQKYIEPLESLRLKFNKTIPYYLFSK